MRSEQEIDDGGNAFPACNEANINQTMGMTLRDWFAAKAMPVFMNQSPSSIGTRDTELARQYIAMASYALADAMLKARLPCEF